MLGDIIRKLMKPDRTERYESADEVIHDLTRFQNNESVDSSVPASQPAKPLTTVGRNQSLHRLITALGILVAAIVLSVLIFRASDTEFIVTTNDPEIATRVDKSGGIVVENLTTRATYTLKAGPNRLPHGDYELVVTSPDGLELTTPRFRLRRFGSDVSTTIVARPSVSTPGESADAEPDKMTDDQKILAAGSMQFDEPQLVPFVDGNTNGSNPTVTGDGLRIIFVSRRESESNQLCEATRDGVDQPFSAAKPFSLSLTGFEPAPVETLGTPFVSADGLRLLVYILRPDVQQVDLCQTTRASLDAPWEPLQSLEGPVNAHGIKYAPSLRADGLELLWFRPEPSDVFDGNLWSARRRDVESPFENAHQLAGSIHTVESEQHPCVSHDGLLLTFDRGTPDPRLWYSVRSATSDDFTDASPIAFPETWMDRNAYAPSMTHGSAQNEGMNVAVGMEG